MRERICKYFVLTSCISFFIVHNPRNLVAQSLPIDRDYKGYAFTKRDKISRLRFSLEKIQKEDNARLRGYSSAHIFHTNWEDLNGRSVHLHRIDPTGMPEYFVQHNESSAKTISSFDLRPGGNSGLSLTGKDITVGVWDQGIIFEDHDFFQGRIRNVDGGNISWHSTHVTGTIAGNSSNNVYDGMAIEANIEGYVWDDLEEDLLNAVESGMLLSNHSYGVLSGWTYDASRNSWVWLAGEEFFEDPRFGYYSFSCQMIDAILEAAPYHLLVRSAGNDRNERGPAEGQPYLIENTEFTEPRQPDGGEDGYDCIPTVGVGKNVLTVGAVFSIPDGYSEPSDVVMSSFSGWGPADDGRIKPDIVASGVNIASAYYIPSQDPETDLIRPISGTSMSTPAVTGSLALLQEYYTKLSEGTFLKAASLKGLIIHTADEAGDNPGPDYQFGWGLMNTNTAAQVLKNSLESDSELFSEESLSNQDTFEQMIFVPGDKALTGTICWTDPAGIPIFTNFLNNRNPRLINDLDLRLINIKSGEIHYPFILDPENPSQAARRGDNRVDNVEQIQITSPSRGAYVLQISHKENLQDVDQAFSLFVSGISSFPTLSEAELQSLLRIYEETGGENWNRPWDLAENPFTWVGVEIDDSGSVVSLDLSDNNLQGDFPPVNLPKLIQLDLSDNLLTSFQDSTTATQLDQLDLSENKLTFTHLLPLLRTNIPNFSFKPQDSLSWSEDRRVRFGDSMTFLVAIDSTLPNLTYTWYRNDSLIQSSSNNRLSFDFVQYLDSGRYYVTLSHPEAPDFFLNGIPINVFVNPPICNVIAQEVLTPATCGTSNGKISLNLQGGRLPYTYAWSTGNTESTLSNLSPGVYTVTWEDRNLCRDSLSFTLDSIALPSIQISAVKAANCLSLGSASVAVEGSTGPFEIQWSHGPREAMVSDLTAGLYEIQVSDSNSCNVSDTLRIQELSGPVIQVASFEEAHCGQDVGSVEITVSGDSPPFQILWENGTNTPQLTNLFAGKYQVMVQDSLGCRDTLTYELPGSDTLRIDTVIVADARCGEANGQAEVIVTGGKTPYIFNWASLSDSSQSIQTFLPPTFYSVYVSDQTGCTDSIQFSVLELGEIPEAAFTFQEEGSTLLFRNLSPNASTYRWEFGDGAWSDLPNPSHTYAQIGTYQVQLIVSNELCGSDTLIQEIEISTLTSHHTFLKANDIRIYPSPADQEVFIDLSSITQQFSPEIRVINSIGNTISDFGNVPKGKYLISFSVENFSTGIYTLLIQVDSQTLTRKFFIK